MTGQEAVSLMGEVQADERAFALLSWRAQREPGKSFGSILKECGDPRLWPEYAAPVGREHQTPKESHYG